VLAKMPILIDELLPDEKYPQKVAIEIFSGLFISYFDMVVREVGLQVGYFVGTMKLRMIEPDEYITMELNNNLSESIGIALNNKLNLLPN